MSGDATRIVRRPRDDRVDRLFSEAGRIDPGDLPELQWQWLSAEWPVPDIPVPVDALRVVRPAVREILDAHRGPADDVQWLPASILDASGRRLEAWVLHLPTHVDLLHEDATTWGPSHSPIRYVYDSAKLSGHTMTVYSRPARTLRRGGQVIHVSSRISSSPLVIAEAVADELRRANVTGARLTPAPVV